MTAQAGSPARRRRARSAGAVSAGVLALAIALISVAAAWPIYETPRLWPVAGVAAASAFAIVVAGNRWRWGALTVVALIAALVILLVPVATPQALSPDSAAGGWRLLRGLGDALAAVALGWKQLLTLTLPVGTYQTVLVPFFVLVFAAVAVSTALAGARGKLPVLAALPLIAPAVFGTTFGSSAVSAPLALGPLTVPAPRELGIWIAALGIVAVWLSWAAGRERRAALKRGRRPDEAAGSPGRGAVRRNSLARGAAGILVVGVATTAAVLAAPAISGDMRAVPRDSIDPEVVVRDQVSPLAEFRALKRDDTLTAELFSVSADGPTPSRLRLAVLDGYDGVDFFVGDPANSGRFTRFPSGVTVAKPTELHVSVGPGYSGVWVPLANPLAEPPTFGGARAAQLADSFYVNRDTGGAVAVPDGAGLAEGDEVTALVSAAPDARVGEKPASAQPLVDREALPQLFRWLELQSVSPTGAGLTDAIDKLRARGYLSHSLTDGPGEGAWLTELGPDAPAGFVSSPGGHSAARIEQLFTQLIEQQEGAGERAGDDDLVAAIGDDEQFAAAAALIARALGFDSRVVVGVRLAGDPVPGTPTCADVCEGKHVAAWAEVKGADGVWAPIDASPQIAVPPLLLQKGEQLPEFPTTPEERDASESDPPVGSANDDGSADDEPEKTQDVSLWPLVRAIGLATLALALVALAVLFIPLLKAVRRRSRRSQRRPEARALGAWHELLDHHTDSRGRAAAPVRGESRHGTIEALDSAGISVPDGEWIAATVDRAVYAREGISEETADRLWETVTEHVRADRARIGFWGRLRSRFGLGSFAAAIPWPRRTPSHTPTERSRQ